MKLLCMIAVFLCIPWVASDAQKQDWGNLKRYAEAPSLKTTVMCAVV